MSMILHYWNGRGLAEPCRLMFSLSDKDIHLEDIRYSRARITKEPIKTFKEICSNLEHNLGRLPVLCTNNQTIGQSIAINYYVASELGFLGSSLIESAQILEIQEHLKEMMIVFNDTIPYGTIPTQENLDLWFNQDEIDESPNPANYKTKNKRMMKWWCSRIEYILCEEFAVGNRLSLADILIYCTFYDYLRDNECKEGFPIYKKYPFYSKARTDKILNKFPKIKNICEKIGNLDRTKEYLVSRGEQLF